MTHICVGKLTIIGSDNGLSPGRRQAIIWTNAGILLIWPLGTNFNEIFIGNSNIFIQENALEMLSAKWRPFCLGLNVLKHLPLSAEYNIYFHILMIYFRSMFIVCTSIEFRHCISDIST